MAQTEEMRFDALNTRSQRVIATPTRFAQSHYLYVQEVGTLKSLSPHKSMRQNLDSYLFLIVLAGEGKVEYRGQSHDMSFGSCALIDCKKRYSHMSSKAHPWELMWVHFNGKIAPELYNQYIKANPSGIFRALSVATYKRPLEEMLRLQGTRNNTTELLSNKYITDIITQSILDSASWEEEENDSMQAKLSAVCAYLEEHFADKILLQNLEEEFYVSRYHLSREFKKTYGITIGAYVLNLRLGRAKQLLRFSNLPIEEIAERSGIPDSSYFTKVFRKSEQMTALEYRKKWGNA